MTTTLQDEQLLYDRAVCDAMVASTPDSWNIIVLALERTTTSGIGELLHSLYSPEGHPPVWPDASLYEATYQLDALFERYGRRFTTAVYQVELFKDYWTYRAEYTYEPPRAHPFRT